MSRSDDARVIDILQSCERINEIVARGRGAYDENWESRDAASYNLVIVGEALGALSDEFVAGATRLPVDDSRGLRNKLVHAYWRLDDDILWDTMTEDVPALQSAIGAAVLSSSPGESRLKNAGPRDDRLDR